MQLVKPYLLLVCYPLIDLGKRCNQNSITTFKTKRTKLNVNIMLRNKIAQKRSQLNVVKIYYVENHHAPLNAVKIYLFKIGIRKFFFFNIQF